MPTPKKTRQLAAEMPPPTTVEDALKIIDMFKAEQAALVSHIIKTDANSLYAPPTIKALLQQGERGLSMLAAAIRKNMENVSFRLDDKMESAGFKRGAVTSDDFSDAMLPFVAVIKDLLEKNGDELTKLRLGYDLLFKLKECSQNDLNVYVCYGDRSSDEPADELLSDVIRRRKDAGDTWDLGKDLKELEREAKYNKDHGVEPWFPKSIEALSALSAGNAASGEARGEK